jgi:hypothetical protein
MNNWKLSPIPIVMLRGWSFQESQHRGKTSEPWRRTRPVRLGAFSIRRLLAASRRTTSREALPNGDRRDLHPG